MTSIFFRVRCMLRIIELSTTNFNVDISKGFETLLSFLGYSITRERSKIIKIRNMERVSTARAHEMETRAPPGLDPVHDRNIYLRDINYL